MNVRPIAESLVHGLNNIEWSADDLVSYSCNGALYNDICQVVRRWMDMDSGAKGILIVTKTILHLH